MGTSYWLVVSELKIEQTKDVYHTGLNTHKYRIIDCDFGIYTNKNLNQENYVLIGIFKYETLKITTFLTMDMEFKYLSD